MLFLLYMQGMNARWHNYRVNRQTHRMSKYSAALAAGYPLALAEKHQTTPVPVNFDLLFEQKGLTNLKKVEKILEGINAEKTIFDKDGVPHTTPDWTARLKFIELSLRLCKQLEKDSSSDKSGDVFYFDLAARLNKAREKVKAGLNLIDLPARATNEPVTHD